MKSPKQLSYQESAEHFAGHHHPYSEVHHDDTSKRVHLDIWRQILTTVNVKSCDQPDVASEVGSKSFHITNIPYEKRLVK